jgi:hypothetical protein
VLPLPLTVMGVSPEDARGRSSSVGDGRAKTEETAANAAMLVKVFMILQFRNVMKNW